MKKIAFCGAPGTGKTKLVTMLKAVLEEKGNKVMICPEAVRGMPFDAKDKDSTFEGQFFIISNQLNKENEAALENPDYLLSDRNPIDAYTYWIFPYTLGNNPKKEEQNKVMEDILKFWMNEYDKIFRIRVSEEAWKSRKQDDGFRESDWVFVLEIEKIFDEIIEKYSLDVIEITNDGKIEESLIKIIEEVNR